MQGFLCSKAQFHPYQEQNKPPNPLIHNKKGDFESLPSRGPTWAWTKDPLIMSQML